MTAPSRPAVAGLVIAGAFVLLLLVAPEVALIGFAGVLFAVALDGGAGVLVRFTGMPRLLALPVFMAAVLALFVAVGFFAAPVVQDQVDQLTEQVPRAFASFRDRVRQLPWAAQLVNQVQPERILSATGALAGGAGSALSATFGALGNLAMIFILGLFLAIDPAPYSKGIRLLFPPEKRGAAARVLDELGTVLRGWLLAQLGSMAVIGLLTAIGLWLLGVKLAVALALLAAVLTFIPNLGPILAAVPAVLLALAASPVTALWVVGLYIAVQVIEGNVTTPLMQQHTISLPPALMIAAQLLLGVLFGLLGLALAVPIVAVCTTLVRMLYVESYLERRPIQG